jgi:hypothetical protein
MENGSDPGQIAGGSTASIAMVCEVCRERPVTRLVANFFCACDLRAKRIQPRFGVDVWSAPLRQGVSLLNSKRNFATKKDDASVEMREVKGDPNGKNI